MCFIDLVNGFHLLSCSPPIYLTLGTMFLNSKNELFKYYTQGELMSRCIQDIRDELLECSKFREKHVTEKHFTTREWSSSCECVTVCCFCFPSPGCRKIFPKMCLNLPFLTLTLFCCTSLIRRNPNTLPGHWGRSFSSCF